VSISFDTDIALLKTDYKNKSFFTLGDSDKVKYNTKLTALGFPLGQDNLKYTSGIYSGKQDRFLQIDVPLNGGNSGGPLINENNQVIGINTAKQKEASNVGYATPINDYKTIKEQLFSGVKVVYSPILVGNFSLTDKDMLKYFNVSDSCKGGYYVRQLYEYSPLYKAGIRTGDIICSINNCQIDIYGECSVDWTQEKVSLKDLLFRYSTNDTIKVSYWSNSKSKMNEVNVSLNIPYPYKIKEKYKLVDNIEYEIIGGMTIMELTINHMTQANMNGVSGKNIHALKSYAFKKNRFKGALIVTNVFPGTVVKSRKLIDNGTIIKEVNSQPVNTLEDLRNALKKPKNKNYTSITTNNNTLIVLDTKNIIEEDDFLSTKMKYTHTKGYDILKNNIGYIDKTIEPPKIGTNIIKTNKEVPSKTINIEIVIKKYRLVK
jgi:S1-C subfamily serine protease